MKETDVGFGMLFGILSAGAVELGLGVPLRVAIGCSGLAALCCFFVLLIAKFD